MRRLLRNYMALTHLLVKGCGMKAELRHAYDQDYSRARQCGADAGQPAGTSDEFSLTHADACPDPRGESVAPSPRPPLQAYIGPGG
jgi:hypothetical protein